MLSKKEIWGYGLEFTGIFLLLVGVLLLFNLGSWDKEKSERRYILQEEINLAVLSSLNDIASIQSTDDKEYKETVAKSVTDATNNAYSSVIMEKERRSIEFKAGQFSTFRVFALLLLIIGILFIVRGRWIGIQGITERAKEIN